MFRNLRHSCLAAATVFSLLIVPAAAHAQSTPDAIGPVFLPLVTGPGDAVAAEVVTDEASLEEQEAAIAFMTREQIAAAGAMEIPVQAEAATADDLTAAAASARTQPLGTPGFTLPARAAPGADLQAAAAFAADWVQADPTAEELSAFEGGLEAEAQAVAPAEAQGTSQIYTSFMANLVSALQTQPPHKWIGRLTVSTPTGTSYCSATVIRGNNIVTAAHCVYDTFSRNAWYTNRVFTPAYRNGSMPYGTFAAATCTILTAYINKSGSYSIAGVAPVDIAVCTLGRNRAGQTINTAVGNAGTAWNYGYTRSVFNLGYPLRDYRRVVLSWSGAYLRACAGETFAYTTDVRGMGCNWGGGISGGPWIDSSSLAYPTTYGTNGYAPGLATGFVTSVNSGGVTNAQNLYGARFTTGNFRTLCGVRGC